MRRSVVALPAIVLTTFITFSGTLVLSGKPQNRSKPQLRQKSSSRSTIEYLKKEVRHELLTLPYYGIFDWLEADIRNEDTVVLRGQVIRPTTKSDAENRVKRIEGVERVINRIEVLPLSPNDDRLRRALYRALFNNNSPLFRYSMGTNPSIHLIVKNGHATLKGVVLNRGDSQIAYIKARGVPGLFGVTNELRTER
jgi:hyperosmotically inducible periplasmic protein